MTKGAALALSLFDFAGRWQEVREAIRAEIAEWRLQHPKATRREIEAAVDERLAELRTRMLQDVALTSPAADLSGVQAQDRPVCPQCGTPIEPRGPREWQVTTHQGKTLRRRRSYAVSRPVRWGFSPLDEALAWLPGALTPQLQESLEQTLPAAPAGPTR